MRFIKLFFVCFCLIFFSIQQAIAFDDAELKERIQKMAESRGIKDKKQIEMLESYVRSIMETKEKLVYEQLKAPCRKDLKYFCPDSMTISDRLECLKKNREDVSKQCQIAVIKHFGSQPLKNDTLHCGVMIPKGSTFLYRGNGNITAANISKDFIYNGISFKKGMAWFHDQGIRNAKLKNDQVINGIRYKADGIGPFFYSSGKVENATLAENTKINGIIFRASTQIQYYAQRRVKIGVFAEDTVIKGEKYLAGTKAHLNQKGEIIRTYKW